MAWKYRNPASVETHAEIADAIEAAKASVQHVMDYSGHYSKNDVRRLHMTYDGLERLRVHMEMAMRDEYPFLPWHDIAATYHDLETQDAASAER